MNRHRVTCTGAFLAVLFALTGCGGDAGGDDAEAQTDVAGGRAVSGESPLLVYAVNYPLAYYAERIGGDEVRVEFPVPAGEDPAYWDPTPEQIAGFQSADLVLLNGAGYAAWTETAALPRSKLVNTSASVADRLIEAEESVVHAHGPEGEHEHGTLAFTTWLDPTIAIEQARAIRDALTARRPAAKPSFDNGFAGLESDLLALDSALEEAAAGVGGAPVLGSHPVYQYLARRYGLDLRSVHFEPDEAPSEAGWREIGELQQARPAAVMLWEAEPLDATASRLASDHGITSIVFDPCANRPDVDDYLVVMRDNARRLSAIAD